MPLPSDPAGAVPARRSTRFHFVRQILRLAGPYWRSERKWKIRGFTLLLILLTVAQVALAVWTNYWNRELFDALEERSIQGLLLQTGVFALIFLVTIGVTAAHLMVKRWLMLGWRAWLTERLVNHWMKRGRHYRLTFTPGEHDNPDGRIAEDIRIATETAIALAHTLVYSMLILGSFLDILWSISGSVDLPGTSIRVPGYMVPLAFLYAGLGTLFGWMLGRPLVRSTNRLQTAEADFRFGLVRARENSEAIALLHGERRERENSARRFADIKRCFDAQSLAYMGIVAFGTGYGTLLPVFPILIAAPRYIFGAITLGVLMQAAQAFQKLTSALSWPIDNLGEIARCRASADRVLSLYEDMLALDAREGTSGGHRIRLSQGGHARLLVEDLTIAGPSGQILIEHLDMEVHRGEKLLIAGDPAVTGSFFKVIGGLWPWGSGSVRLPDERGILFMPQRPFLPEGTLRTALCYPHPPETFSIKCIHYALECAGIAWLAPRLEETDNWERTLPLRAQQRLGFARILVQRPSWIFMDEATDAFDPRSEQLIFEMLRHELPDTTVLVISFHPGIEPIFDRKIVLNRLRESRFLFQDDSKDDRATSEGSPGAEPATDYSKVS